MIQKILPNSAAKLRILKTVYKNAGINFTALVKKSGTSPNIVLGYVNRLVEQGILREKRIGGKKKTHIRLFSPNLQGIGIDLFSFVELEEKNKFLDKYRELRPLFRQLEALLRPPKADFSLVYGSFARFAADKDSDLDLWIVGKVDAETKKRIREIFSTLDRDFNVTIEEREKFLGKIGEPIRQNMIKDHVIICGERGFLKTLSGTSKDAL